MTWLLLAAEQVPADIPPVSLTGHPLLDLLLRNATPVAMLLIALWLFLTNRVFPGAERERLLAKLEKTESQRDLLRDSIDDRVIPLATRMLDLLERIEREREADRDHHRDSPRRRT